MSEKKRPDEFDRLRRLGERLTKAAWRGRNAELERDGLARALVCVLKHCAPGVEIRLRHHGSLREPTSYLWHPHPEVNSALQCIGKENIIKFLEEE